MMGRSFEVRKLSMAKTAGQKSKLYAKYGKQLYLAAKNALLSQLPDLTLEVDQITFVPQTQIDIAAEGVPLFEKFLQMLNDCDDVQEVYRNGILPS